MATMTSADQILLHASCPCGVVVRSVRAGKSCLACGRIGWRAKHVPAFEVVFEWGGQWYGVQDYERVHTHDDVELLAGDTWQQVKVAKTDALGFYVERTAGHLEYYSLAGEGTLWRSPARSLPDPEEDAARIGPFESKEAAENVRFDHAPGYLVCGVCGEDDWKTKLPAHYRQRHPRSLEVVVDELPKVIAQRLL